MARLFADENFPFPVVEHLRLSGHDIVTAKDFGLAGEGVPDATILESATRDNRAIITFNRRDFIRLHNQGASHAGIIVCSADNAFRPLADRNNAAIANLSDQYGELVRVNR